MSCGSTTARFLQLPIRQCSGICFALNGFTKKSKFCRALLSSLTAGSGRVDTNNKDDSREKDRNYLQVWLGGGRDAGRSTPSAPRLAQQSATSADSLRSASPLVITGSSYLIPTLRLERSDTPQSLAERLRVSLEEAEGSDGRFRTSFQKTLQSILTSNEDGGRWQAPIVLDLASLLPDGSPHYVPPKPETLKGFLQVLSDYGITVVAVSNPPPASSGDPMALEISRMGTPVLMSKGGGLAAEPNGASAVLTCGVEDLIHLVWKRGVDPSFCSIDEEEGEQNEQEQTQSQTSTMQERGLGSVLRRDTVMNLSFREVQRLCKALGLPAVGSTEVLRERLTDFLDTSSSRPAEEEATLEEDQPLPLDAPKAPLPLSATIYRGSVRSGQQISSEPKRSLVVLGNVSSGGEVISDGDIYIFGRLRGRAIGGLAHKKNLRRENEARIFASSFDPELICIGSDFTTIADVRDFGLEEPGVPAMVSLNEHMGLVFEQVEL